MCQLCVEIQKENMSASDIARAYIELEMPEDHWKEIMKNIHNYSDLREFAKEMGKIKQARK